jgi:hypothetical protein
LKPSYFRQAVKNLAALDQDRSADVGQSVLWGGEL